MEILSIIQNIQSLWVLFIMVMLFVRFRIGVAAYLAYIFLVPFMKIEIGGYVLQWNFINILVLLAFFVNQYRKGSGILKLDYSPLIPFFIYFGVSLILMPFQDGIPVSEAFSTWRMQVMKYLILPFVIWNDILVNHASIKLYRNVTVGCIIIAVLYGLYLTTMPGINPYIIAISSANGEEFNFAYAAGNSGVSDNEILNEERLFGRISSAFSHPMTYGLFLGLSMFYIYRNKESLSKLLFYGMILFILTDIFVCGVRSAIAAISIAILILLLQTRNTKIFIYIIFSAIGLYVLWDVIVESPTLYSYITSIFDPSNSEIGGSTVEMRIEQFQGCLEEIRDNILEGKGFGWTGYYMSIHDGHPTMLYFESLIFVVLCNSGIIGVILWIFMSIKIIKYNRSHPLYYILNTLYVFYIAYACITGEYGYMQYFILFYILMLAEDLHVRRIENINSCQFVSL